MDGWTDFFFQGCSLKVIKLFRDLPRDPEFREFQESQSWQLGRRASDNMPPGHDILVLWMTARKGKSRTQYAAKTFADFPRERAEARIRTSGLKNHSVEEVQKQLDPFWLESRAFEHVMRCCSNSQKIYFPRYFGVLKRIQRQDYPLSYLLRPRAIVLEAIKPELASRRVLAANSPTANRSKSYEAFSQALDQMALSDFERCWYRSLFSDRFRRLLVLHDIGATHGDVRDDHFRLPGDFYDTVLYDFSSSYTFYPTWPCIRRPKPLSAMTSNEQNILLEILLDRAEQCDLRHYFARSLQLSPQVVEGLCSQTINSEIANLELIVLKVMVRPDEFSMPSLASILPFLEAIRPENKSTWHISRARLLQYYDSAWVLYPRHKEVGEMTLVSLSEKAFLDTDTLPVDDQHTFFLLLFPRSWDIGEAVHRLMAACSDLILSGKQGSVLSRAQFDNL
ncbi:hypothetical protein BDV25DRAFT_170364 [Aspergillus avenaceus]|uniref:Uncharacterized protein n=1 Tax=Aspergillus avenaceus TaxID=36643 RepID=A0A5N6U8Y5_ASPAV|nr:hypothetical protein BDV25DRAFT_170364 [Aspergillus avenaceus]